MMLGPLFGVLTISLFVVLFILIRTLNKISMTHRYANKKAFFKCMAVIFTLSYALRACYSFTIGYYIPGSNWINIKDDFRRTLLWVISYLFWDIPSLFSILLLHWCRDSSTKKRMASYASVMDHMSPTSSFNSAGWEKDDFTYKQSEENLSVGEFDSLRETETCNFNTDDKTGFEAVITDN